MRFIASVFAQNCSDGKQIGTLWKLSAARCERFGAPQSCKSGVFKAQGYSRAYPSYRSIVSAPAQSLGR